MDISVFCGASLPTMSIYGNSHFMFQEKNNAELADLIFSWLKEHGL